MHGQLLAGEIYFKQLPIIIYLNIGYWDPYWVCDSNNLRFIGGTHYWLHLWMADHSADFTGFAILTGRNDHTD